ncbi:transglycosylase domain-containing protein [Micromonospora matsumotoense]|uniref:transglycosylase domain-containing protein n=1 Tax=Micromonospora matsumotoense TaxID=121616 RepID=UPI003D917C9C
MNSYGDPSSPRARAQVPGSNGGPGPGADDAYPRRGGDARGAAPAGRASVGGAAPTGRASAAVPPPRATGGAAPVGRAGPGRASVPVSPAGPGRASVPVSPAASGWGGAGRASVPVSPAGGPAGRVSVGTAPAGRASVGAASVGSAGRASVARAGVAQVGGGGGPGGPNGPGRGYGGGAGGGRGRGPGDPDALARAKRRKRINLLIAGFAVFIMLAGLGVVGFTYYSTTVVLPAQIKLPLATTIYAADNKTVIAKVGEQNRTFVSINQIPQHMRDAVAAAEDKNFYEHAGVDYKGIARAAWNNLSNGDKQGASTITQQYARNAYENLQDDSYARKVKEAIVASKLNDQFTKEQIMEHYLNTIYFGRNAYGIEAAAQTYFGKSVSKIDVAEAAVLAALIKQPEPSATHKGFDPALNPVEAKDRWDYVIKNMIEMRWVDAPGRPAHPTEYPTKTLQTPKESRSGVKFGVNTPIGNVINYVSAEMREKKLCTDNDAEVTERKPRCSAMLREGGYRIRTTIDNKVQKAVTTAAQRSTKGSELDGARKNLMAAVVSVDPRNGRVLGYYGGDDGTGTDYAGTNTDTNGNITGGHSPGSSFKIYTLAAALEAGKSVDSRWKGRAFTPEGDKFRVSNAGTDNPSCGDSCTLRESTLKSLNVPFYHVSLDIGPDKIVDMAAKAGVSMMWQTNVSPPKGHDLAKEKAADLAPDPFYHVVAYGQYPITVLDHANGIATFANKGIYNKAHFLISAEKQNKETGKWEKLGGEQLKPQKRINPDVVADVTDVLKDYPGKINHTLADGRKATAKTGTWELKEGTDQNGDAWTIGYTPQLATAVWVGNKGKREAIKLNDGTKISGATMPGEIWERVMNGALKGEDKLDFPPAAKVGDPESGNGTPPPPPPPPPNAPTGPNCAPTDLQCLLGGGNQGGNNPGGNQGGNPGGNQGGNPGGNNPGGSPVTPPNQNLPGQNGGNGGGLLPTPRTRD